MLNLGLRTNHREHEVGTQRDKERLNTTATYR